MTPKIELAVKPTCACVCQQLLLAMIDGIQTWRTRSKITTFTDFVYVRIMPLPDLRCIVKSTIVNYLACSSDTSRDYVVMLEYFRSCGQGFFSEEILSKILEDFPQDLTDELLIVLSPPHLRHLQLTNCSRLTCSGLEKAISKCQQLQAIDFSNCIHLLRPAVFCCIRDKAPNLVSLSFENSEVVSDDIVQVVLMCCPGLRHLNLSSCKDITDKAFAFPQSKNTTWIPESQTSVTSTPHYKHQPGRNLTSVDISGCNSLSTMAVRHLVDLCGPSLTTINISWTGVGCTALLHLAGLSLREVARIVREADSACSVLLEMPSSEEEQMCDNGNMNADLLKMNEQHFQGSGGSSGAGAELLQTDGNNQELLQDSSGCSLVHQDLSCTSNSLDDGLVNQVSPHCSVQKQNEISESSEQHNVPSTVANDMYSVTEQANSISLKQDSYDLPPSCETDVVLDMNDQLVTHNAGSRCIGSSVDFPSVSPQNGSDHSNSTLLNASNGGTRQSIWTQALSPSQGACSEEEELGESYSASDLEAEAIDACTQLLDLDDSSTVSDTRSAVSSFRAAVSRLSWALGDLMSQEEKDESFFDDFLGDTLSPCSSGCQTLLPDDNVSQASCDSSDMNPVYGSQTLHVETFNTLRSVDPTEMSILPQNVNVNLGVTSDQRHSSEDSYDSKGIPSVRNTQNRFPSCEESLVSGGIPPVVRSSQTTSADVNESHSERSDDEFLKPSDSCDVIEPEVNFTPLSTQDPTCETFKLNDSCREGLFNTNNVANIDGINETRAKKMCWGLPEDEEEIIENTIKECSCTSKNPTILNARGQIKGSRSEKVPDNTVEVKDSNPIMPSAREMAAKESGKEEVQDDSCDTESHPIGPFETENNRTRDTDVVSNRKGSATSSGSRVTTADLLAAQTYQPKISTLDISNIYYHSKALGVACLKIFCAANKCLKTFSISWSELDDSVLKCLLKNEPELESLSLMDCDSLSNLSLISIPLHCPKLSSVDLKGVCYVTDHGVMPLTRSNNLETLSLAEAAIGDSTLESIGKACGPRMKDLDLSWCEDVTDRGLSIIASSCPALQRLGIRQCAAAQSTLNSLAANCHLMTSLNIAGIDSLTDKMLSRLAVNMPSLKEVDVSWNSSLTDTGIAALLLHCCGLRDAVFSGLKFITSAPFLGIIGDLARWRLLEEVWKCHKKSPSAGAARGKVAFKACDSNTAKSLGDQIPSRSMSYAPSLRHMTLEYSDKVNDDHLAAIVAVCRGTLFIRDYYAQPIEPRWIFR